MTGQVAGCAAVEQKDEAAAGATEWRAADRSARSYREHVSTSAVVCCWRWNPKVYVGPGQLLSFDAKKVCQFLKVPGILRARGLVA